eukprot:Opistho-1_new@27578
MARLVVAAALLALAGSVLAVPLNHHLFRGGLLNRVLGDQEREHQLLGAPPVKAYEPQWFTQKVNHFDPSDDRTWKQRFFINSDYWKGPGYPIFLMIGGEGPIGDRYVSQFSFVEDAKANGALILALEHRFYGESFPTEDVTVASLKLLSSQHALADLAYFRMQMTIKLDAPLSRWITFGGSYPGSLSSYVRQKYPHLFHASVDSSGPVLAELDFYQYLEVVENALRYYGGDACVNSVASAISSIQTLIATKEGKEQLATTFKTCDPIATVDDVPNFMQTMAGNIMGIVQYNNEASNITVSTVCDTMASTDDKLKAFASINDMLLQASSLKCLDAGYDSFLEQMRNTSIGAGSVGGRSWLYQTCQEFGYYQTTDSPTSHVFGNLFPLPFSLKICRDVFDGEDLYTDADFQNRISWTNAYYGGVKVVATNILHVHGTIDPWHALGITSSTDPQQPAILITGTAHCANMRLAKDTDIPALVAARTATSAQIVAWLAQP